MFMFLNGAAVGRKGNGRIFCLFYFGGLLGCITHICISLFPRNKESSQTIHYYEVSGDLTQLYLQVKQFVLGFDLIVFYHVDEEEIIIFLYFWWILM